MKTPPPIERAVSNVAWLLERFEQMQQSIYRPSLKGLSVDGDGLGPWAIANRVCDRYRLPKGVEAFRAVSRGLGARPLTGHAH